MLWLQLGSNTATFCSHPTAHPLFFCAESCKLHPHFIHFSKHTNKTCRRACAYTLCGTFYSLEMMHWMALILKKSHALLERLQQMPFFSSDGSLQVVIEVSRRCQDIIKQTEVQHDGICTDKETQFQQLARKSLWQWKRICWVYKGWSPCREVLMKKTFNFRL